MGLKLEKDCFKDQKYQPGPASYSPIKSKKTLLYSMSGRNDVKLSMTKPEPPGPGTYNDMISIHYSTLTGSKIGSDQRNSYFLKSACFSKPGPGTY
jgi:hypothetical protein